jgi:phosphatidylserine/phosphatidylglycerophosphate/cardiolipin synthase-like enzyme
MNHIEGPSSPVRDNFSKALEFLHRIGCEVVEASRVHSKVLAADNSILVEGSYNWLSAVSDRNSQFHNRETSQLYQQSDIADVIKNEWTEFGLN